MKLRTLAALSVALALVLAAATTMDSLQKNDSITMSASLHDDGSFGTLDAIAVPTTAPAIAESVNSMKNLMVLSDAIPAPAERMRENHPPSSTTYMSLFDESRSAAFAIPLRC